MPGKINVAVVSMARGLRRAETRDDNLRYIADTMSEIAAIKPDLVALPETFSLSDLNLADRTPEGDVEFLCEQARKHHTYIVGSTYEQRDGRWYNTAPIIDRAGRVVGRYDKTHLTDGDIDVLGTTPGATDQPPVETDFGTIGVQICFDVNWPDQTQRLAEAGAELIVFPSAFPAGCIIESLAAMNHVYIAAAVQQMPAGILDNAGRWMTQTDRFRWWVWQTIDLDRIVFHWDYQGEKLKDIVAKYGPKITVETFGPEAWFTLESNSSDVSVPEIAKEFGLITYRQYIARSTANNDRARP